MKPAIAIVGIACQYPDATSPAELWENVLAQRRAFRRIPDVRLSARDYVSGEGASTDCTYMNKAAVIEGYEFDRVRYRVVGSTYREVDLVHWLALDTAARALADAGFPDGNGLPRSQTGVIVGNTLTGEFSRAAGLRLRWPFVRRIVGSALAAEGWTTENLQPFLERLQVMYQEPFPPVGEETLAGALSNTIAGRVCNHFDLKGGGFTVDGACASSLLAVTCGCSALAAGDLDVAVVGGVDVSIDPFELVGFARLGALARTDMRVYDARSAGFWPGEGCGFVVLMRAEDATSLGLRSYALVRGWGVSSDGKGGITRPDVDGQKLALRRAYERAGFGIESVTYFEGHGTGTPVGDAVELQSLSDVRREADSTSAAAIGSIKAIIGHTKAAAGIAGLIKATAALQAQVLPPTAGCEQPHPILGGPGPQLRVLRQPEPWPTDRPLRAGVSAMGFGGINTHVVLESVPQLRRSRLSVREQHLGASHQDVELFLLGAASGSALRELVERIAGYAAQLSLGNLTDLAASLSTDASRDQLRAAIVASTPDELEIRLRLLGVWLADGQPRCLDVAHGTFLASGVCTAHIGFLFPGQGAPAHVDGGALRRRFDDIGELYEGVALPSDGDGRATGVAQPAILAASIAGMRSLARLGVDAQVSVGHSLGELTALHWAGVYDEAALMRIGTARGAAMMGITGQPGAMASLSASADEVSSLLADEKVVIAGLNAPHQTVISGPQDGIDRVLAKATERGLRGVRLGVSHAFHSQLVAPAVPALALHLGSEILCQPTRRIISTVTGGLLDPSLDIGRHLCEQITAPVRFEQALRLAAVDLDLLVEVGPGATLRGLAEECVAVPCVAVDAGGPSLRGLLGAVGAAFALGAPIKPRALFIGRLVRPFGLDWRPRFFSNPCELAPTIAATPHDAGTSLRPELEQAETINHSQLESPSGTSALDLVRQLVAQRTELPAEAVRDDHRFLSDLHLNSIAVGQLIGEAARRLGLPSPVAPTEYATATVATAAAALDEVVNGGPAGAATNETLPLPGVDAWVRAFTIELVDEPLRHAESMEGEGTWQVLAAEGDRRAGVLRERFDDAAGGGVIVCGRPELSQEYVAQLLEGARNVLANGGTHRFVLLRSGGGECGAAFARTLHLEAPWITTCVVDTPADDPRAPDWVHAEVMAASGYVEAHYDGSGNRRAPVLRPLALDDPRRPLPFGPSDVLLVTGGGKGIAAECALALAKQSGVGVLLLGRSDPSLDEVLASNLERFAASSVRFRYASVDVTDRTAVRAAIVEAEASFGPVTGILHGAGSNTPRLIEALDEQQLARTVAPKVDGLRNVLEAVNESRIRVLVAFGSIIARTGLRGEADYALANEALARAVEAFGATHPHCLCLTTEWSIWSGVGMGERLGRVDTLARHGIVAIPPEQGVAILGQLLTHRLPTTSIVVCSRVANVPTLKILTPDLPLMRFLERCRVYYPAIELIVDTDLSVDNDPYLEDHVYRGDRLFPAVMGLEAMAEVAMALAERSRPPVFEQVEFRRPIVVPGVKQRTIRVAALARDRNTIEVALRSDETDFQTDHFRAVCRWPGQPRAKKQAPAVRGGVPIDNMVEDSLDPTVDLYGPILFHKGRFRRIRRYRWLRSQECIAEFQADARTNWFGRYMPEDLVLADPGARDAGVHAIQACIPYATLLPIAVDRVVLASTGPAVQTVHARERSRNGACFVYDLELHAQNGTVRETWEGLRLQQVDDIPLPTEWSVALAGPYLERRARELLHADSLRVVMARVPDAQCHIERDSLIAHALASPVRVLRRSDGKPEASNGSSVSAAYAGQHCIVVVSEEDASCDLEPVTRRATRDWRALLGSERFRLAQEVAKQAGEESSSAATRVWAAAECLKKAGAVLCAPLSLEGLGPDQWVTLKVGPLKVATTILKMRGASKPLAVALLARRNDASL